MVFGLSFNNSAASFIEYEVSVTIDLSCPFFLGYTLLRLIIPYFKSEAMVNISLVKRKVQGKHNCIQKNSIELGMDWVCPGLFYSQSPAGKLFHISGLKLARKNRSRLILRAAFSQAALFLKASTAALIAPSKAPPLYSSKTNPLPSVRSAFN